MLRRPYLLLLAIPAINGFIISPNGMPPQRSQQISQRFSAHTHDSKRKLLLEPPRLRNHAIRPTLIASASAQHTVNVQAKDVWSVTGVGITSVGLPFGGEKGADVTTFRHDEYGTGLELWQGSFGWFDFTYTDGAPVMLCDSWAVQVERPSQVFSSAAQYSLLRQQAKQDKSLNKLKEVAQMGCWQARVQGPYVLVENKNSKRQSLVLTADGFVFLGTRGRALLVQKGSLPQDMDVLKALEFLPGL